MGKPIDANAAMSIDANAAMSIDADAAMSIDTDAAMSIDTDAAMSIDTDAAMSIDTDAAQLIAVIEAAQSSSLEADGEVESREMNKPGFQWRTLWKGLASIPSKGNEVLGVLNGFVGDRLEEEGSTLALPMVLLAEGRELDLSRPLADQISNPTSALAIFVHGLMCTETIWTFPNGSRRSFADRLHEDVGVTAIHVRYNTGRHISTNGHELAALLDVLHRRWPTPVEGLNLIGYSMGGLVARSAAHYAEEAKYAWVGLLTRMFLIGVPLRGSSLEQLFHIAAFTLKVVPNLVTQIIAWVFRQRSSGIRDLRHGYIVDEEWNTRDADALSFGRRYKVPLTKGVAHYVIAGNLADNEHHPLAKVVGDSLVTPFSAKDEGIDGTPSDRVAKGARVFGGLGHLAIVNDDAVYQQILTWWHE